MNIKDFVVLSVLLHFAFNDKKAKMLSRKKSYSLHSKCIYQINFQLIAMRFVLIKQYVRYMNIHYSIKSFIP
jgi:hypothetical protein